MTRIERYRAYMARMNPVADPATAIREKLYVRPPGRNVADELATRLELEPASTHLVLGGIGSGKTSELLVARERLDTLLDQVGDHVEYIDVSRAHDLGASDLSGVMVALADRSLARGIRDPALSGEGEHAVFLFDSMDRLPNPDRFREAVQNDLRTLKAAGIGVVVVGPLRFMVGIDRAIADLFDQAHFLLAYDPATDGGLAFLTQVLRARAETDALPDACLAPLARASGGVMRDLISLAKRAGHEAYAVGHDRITLNDVARAVDAFGRSLAIGLDDEQVKKLRHVQKGKGFVIRGEQELSLLETGRILLRGESRFAVHPALAPLLDAIPEAA